MSAEAFVVAGTDTGIGKTVFSAALTLALDAVYWKPVQSGLPGDTETVKSLTGLPDERFLPEAYRLKTPCSPHRAAEIDGHSIDPLKLALPRIERRLVVELAGGLLVPYSKALLQIEVAAGWKAPVVLCARTALGTINHTLLSLEALRARRVPVLGVAFIGEPDEAAERAVVDHSGARRLGRLPRLKRLDPVSLRRGFEEGFRREDFTVLAASL